MVRVSVPLICTQSVGALIPSAFVRAKCVASFFPFCPELFSSCIYIFFFFFCVCVPTSALVGYCNVEMD